jgi:hypothetical protein
MSKIRMAMLGLVLLSCFGVAYAGQNSPSESQIGTWSCDPPQIHVMSQPSRPPFECNIKFPKRFADAPSLFLIGNHTQYINHNGFTRFAQTGPLQLFSAKNITPDGFSLEVDQNYLESGSVFSYSGSWIATGTNATR